MSCFESLANTQRLPPLGVVAATVRLPLSAADLTSRVWLACLMSWLLIGALAAQGPGTRPPPEVMEGEKTPPDGVPAEAFLFLDESGTPVMMPRMTWEEIERLKNLESGIDSPTQSYVFQSLQIEGSVEHGRALWDIDLRLTVDPTQGRWVAVPLGMGNFHRLEPPQVSGAEGFRMTVDGDGLGYVMWIKSEDSSDVSLKMQMASRVEGAATRSVHFDLPDVTSAIRLRIEETGISGQVVGRGDEVVQTNELPGGQTMLAVESAGGKFSLRWGSVERGRDRSPLLEVDSRVDVRWDSPQDQPIASVQMTVRSLRGALRSFEVRLPKAGLLLDTPTIASDATGVEVTGAFASDDGERLQVTIPEDERLQRIDLSLDMQLENSEASASRPLNFRVPEVTGALSQRGEIVVRITEDYRLRWRSRPWVQNVLGAEREVGSTRRSYVFQFDRGSFELPLWLSPKQRQLRLTSETEISLLDDTARLEMTIRPDGQAAEGRGLQIDMAAWRFRSSSDLETGEQLDSFVADEYREIEFNSRGGNEPAPVRILAERPLDREQPPIAFDLPRIVETDESLLVQQASLVIRGDGRESFVLDLQNSTGLDRITSAGSGMGDDVTLSRFRILPPDARAHVVGHLIEQPQRITLASQSTVELDGDSLRTVVDWTVTSQLDLEGRLPVQLVGAAASSGPGPQESNSDSEAAGEPRSGASDLSQEPDRSAVSPTGGASRPSDGEPSDAEGMSSGPAPGTSPAATEPGQRDDSAAAAGWTVTVNGAAAALQATGDGRYELISDRLTSGSMSIRWRHSQPIVTPPQDGSTEVVPMPRPAVAEVTVRGTMGVSLRGDQQLELVATNASGASELELESLPRDPLSVRLRSRAVALQDLSVRRAVLRTAVGPEARHEQVLATVDGGGAFEVGLPPQAGDVVVEAFVDQSPVEVRRRGDHLDVFVPVDSATHVVDLRVWIPMNTPSLFARVEPVLRLPVGVERIYWQVVTPSDSHVVWASPTIGRAMSWQFDRWRLSRQPTEDNQTLIQWAGGSELVGLPPGNRYLYVGSDVPSFRAVTVSRGLLWMIIGSLVLAAATLLTYVPRTRHPLTAVAAAVLFTGLLALAPDAAVLAGQVTVIALILIVVMISIRSLVSTQPSSRVLSSTRSSRRSDSSTHSAMRGQEKERSSLPATESISGPASASEVTS